MSAWKTLGHDYQRTSADPDGDITSLGQVWVRYGGSDSKNGWAGGILADDSSIYYFFSSYYSTIGGTGDRFSLAKFNKDGTLQWSNKSLGGHNTRKTWPSKVGDYIIYHDYVFARVDIFTGAQSGGYIGGDSYGTLVANPGETKFFSSRVAANEGFQGYLWVKGFDATVFPSPLHTEQLWTKNAADSAGVVDNNKSDIAYDNSKIFYAPKYTVNAGVTFNFPSGLYCWDEAGVQQWSVAASPLQQSTISAGNSRVYLFEGSSLVARLQSNGTISWSVVVTGSVSLGQPPVLANGLVIISTSTGIYAYNGTTGTLIWSAAISGLTFADPNNDIKYTVLAAALSSNTLIATALGGIYVLSLTDGSQVQLYNPPAITGRAVNPIVVGNRVYVTDTPDAYSVYWPQAVVCLENSTTPSTDVTIPSTPGNPTFSSVTTTSMTVSWVASTDNVSVGYYNLYYRISSGIWNTIVKTTLSHNFTSLTDGTTYEFYVNAVDTSGNISANSATTSQATSAIALDVTPPSAPGNPTFSNVTTASITVSWTASTDNIAVSYYTLYFRQLGSSWSAISKTSTSHTFTGLTSGITYEFFVDAVDTSGNVSADSSTTSQATTSIPTVDITPPSTPGNPSFGSVTETSMIVSWAVSTDASGINSYNLFWRPSGGIWSAITQTSASHTFTGLVDNTTYEFYVSSTDNAGNISANSSITSQATLPLSVFTQITGNVSVNPTTGQRTVHNLSWIIAGTVMELQRKTQKTAWSTIYTGNPPYSYSQTDLNTNYYYRILLDGVTLSNQIILKSSRK